jgi:hypothetical protein
MVMEDLEQPATYDDDPSSLNAAALSVLQRNKALKQILETKQKQREAAKPSTGDKLKSTIKTGADVLSKVAPDPKVKIGAKVVSTILSDEELKQVYGEEGAYDALFAWMKREGLTSGLSKDRYIDAMKDNPDNFTKHINAFKQAMDAGKPPQVKKAEFPKIETGKSEKTGEVKPFNPPKVETGKPAKKGEVKPFNPPKVNKDDPNVLKTMDRMVGKDKQPDATEELLESAIPEDIDMDFNDDGVEDELDWEAFAESLRSEVGRMKAAASESGPEATGPAKQSEPAVGPEMSDEEFDKARQQVAAELGGGEEPEKTPAGGIKVRNYFKDLQSLASKDTGHIADFAAGLGGALIKGAGNLYGTSKSGPYKGHVGSALGGFIEHRTKASQERRLADQAKAFLVESEGKRAELIQDIQKSQEYRNMKSPRAQMDFMVKMLTSFDQSQRMIAGQYFNRIGGQVKRSTVNNNG